MRSLLGTGHCEIAPDLLALACAMTNCTICQVSSKNVKKCLKMKKKTKDSKGAFCIQTSVFTVWTRCGQAVVTSNGNHCGPSSVCTSKHAARGSPCAASMQRNAQQHFYIITNQFSLQKAQHIGKFMKSCLPIPMMILPQQKFCAFQPKIRTSACRMKEPTNQIDQIRGPMQN